MNFRNILLSISVIIIGLCLSLYFQTKQDVDQVNWEQYGTVEFKDEKSHSLRVFNTKITPYNLEDILQEVMEKNRLGGDKTRVMEIGTGNGRILMELKKLFPEVEYYGTNREKTHSFFRRESFILTALKLELFNKQELQEMELPYIVFEDPDFGNRLPYNAEKFDIIFSQDLMSQIKYKFELWNEVLRLLKPGGLALHTDVKGLNIYSKGLILDLRNALLEMRRHGIEINTMEDKSTIRFKKGLSLIPFPVSPHQPIAENSKNLGQELSDTQMGYNLSL
jgi:SAM-dependent methyltransferase